MQYSPAHDQIILASFGLMNHSKESVMNEFSIWTTNDSLADWIGRSGSWLIHWTAGHYIHKLELDWRRVSKQWQNVSFWMNYPFMSLWVSYSSYTKGNKTVKESKPEWLNFSWFPSLAGTSDIIVSDLSLPLPIFVFNHSCTIILCAGVSSRHVGRWNEHPAAV